MSCNAYGGVCFCSPAKTMTLALSAPFSGYKAFILFTVLLSIFFNFLLKFNQFFFKAVLPLGLYFLHVKTLFSFFHFYLSQIIFL